MLEQDKEWISSIGNTLHKDIEKMCGHKPTVEDYIQFFSEFDGYPPFKEYGYSLCKYKECKQTVIQRFNCLWFFPLYTLIAMPFRYIAYGHTGMKRGTKVWDIAHKLTGLGN